MGVDINSVKLASFSRDKDPDIQGRQNKMTSVAQEDSPHGTLSLSTAWRPIPSLKFWINTCDASAVQGTHPSWS